MMPMIGGGCVVLLLLDHWRCDGPKKMNILAHFLIWACNRAHILRNASNCKLCANKIMDRLNLLFYLIENYRFEFNKFIISFKKFIIKI